ncbi:DUF362 domain-containing protein [Selenihalanaerobacter shriftii]|uniref:Uncharacterized conserved protein, DUF362 family n=1 Tax=Selenihalanaerobacter shriftii TaxID=142842 RepID=A0A1T4JQJ9_9FIRM|nr:DUF362 domain-containing protein [Selenihalanaerobacter shriftii]SJZ32365.1 Uncharacterized conserved protein, DUF362 family [Selenihalanaerobacter shriftii]
MLRERRIKESKVAIGEGLEGDVIRNLLDDLNINQKINQDDTVTITPNWVNTNTPETGTVIGPESLRQLIQYIKEESPARIVVATGSGGTETTKVIKQTGYQQVIDEEGIEFVDLNYGPYEEFEIDHPKINNIKLNKLLIETDFLISYTQIKHHEEATVSLGIKNIALAWPPAELHGFPKAGKGIHEYLHEFITAMGELIPIDLTILSGDQGMVGTGPSNGKPVNADLVVTGTDPVATDVVGARLLGFRQQAVHYLHNLIRLEIGEGDLREVNLMGMSLDQAEQKFSQAAYDYKIVLDKRDILPLHLRPKKGSKK